MSNEENEDNVWYDWDKCNKCGEVLTLLTPCFGPEVLNIIWECKCGNNNLLSLQVCLGNEIIVNKAFGEET